MKNANQNIRPLSPVELASELKAKYRAAADKVRAAKSPVERDRWAAEMAVCISELQHPRLAGL